MSADRYVGAVEATDWCTRHAILNSTRLWTGSQRSCRNTGVMWSRHRIVVERLGFSHLNMNTHIRKSLIGCVKWAYKNSDFIQRCGYIDSIQDREQSL